MMKKRKDIEMLKVKPMSGLNKKKYDKKGFKGFKFQGKTFKMKKGGASDFGMLSVKAGIDKNPKATQADRIAGATMKKKSGGMVESRGQKSIQVKKVPFRGIY